MKENRSLINKKDNYFTFLLISLFILLVYILQILFSNFTESFILNQNALSGQYYRFVSAIFLHGSPSHLIYNLFALLLFGFILENIIGTKRFLAVFFSSGILANVFGVFFYPSSLGASGAIYGIIGCIAIIRPMMIVWAFGVVMPMFVAAIIWVIGDLIGLFIPSDVGHIAHLSGILVGILFGLYMRKSFAKPKKPRSLKIPDRYMEIWEKHYMRR